MLLNDRDIRELCLNHQPPMLSPFSGGVQEGVVSYGLCSAGYDLRLGNKLLLFKPHHGIIVDPKRLKSDPEYLRKLFEEVTPSEDGSYFIPPAPSYALGFSIEHIHIPSHIKGRCVGKSTYARAGILINTTPLEPGWRGHLTIEIANTSPCPVIIYAYEGIAQLEFETISAPPEVDYDQKGGKYQDQQAVPTPARIKQHEGWE